MKKKKHTLDRLFPRKLWSVSILMRNLSNLLKSIKETEVIKANVAKYYIVRYSIDILFFIILLANSADDKFVIYFFFIFPRKQD